jgi:hypothetical protein
MTAKKVTQPDDSIQAMLAEEIADFELEQVNFKALQDTERLKRQVSALKKDLTRSLSEQDRIRAALDLITTIDAGHTKPPPWASPTVSRRVQRGTPTLLLSDLHLDEVVDVDEMEGLNAFNREIAEQRLYKTFEQAIMTTRDSLQGTKWDGFNLMLGGDIVSGFIHEEITETNEGTVPATVDYWLDPLAAGIGMLIEEFGKVHISGVVGNHGRLTRKPRAKRRVQDNFDWLIYRMLQRDFKNDGRVSWQVPDSADCMVKLYETNFLFTHGDQFRGGSGIAGALSPLMIGHARKTRRQMIVDRPFDHLVMGHWHTYWAGKGIIVNGSLKGYDEYAYQGNFDFEVPQQAMWITTPENGVTFQWPLQVQDRKKERW